MPRVALMLLLLGSSAAQANICDQAPFGVRDDEWNMAQPELEAIASDLVLKYSPGILGHSRKWYRENVVYKGLQKACHARFSAGDLEDTDLAQAHIDLQQQKTLPPTTLAIRFFHSEGYPAAPDTNVFCESNDPDGHPLWSTRQLCDADKTRRAAQAAEATRAAEALRRMDRVMAEADEQAEHPGVTYIYALFLCVQQTGQCQMQGVPRIALGQFMPGTIYRTLADCQDFARQIAPYKTPRGGRFLIDDSMWYECRRHQRADFWEPVEQAE